MEYRSIIHNHCPCLVSNNGDVKSLNGRGEMVSRKWRYNADGYPVISATGHLEDGAKIYRTIAVHILVAKAWVPNPDNKPEVNHLDFDRGNPVASNLEWVTHKENIVYSSDAGRHIKMYGKANPNYGNRTLHQKYLDNPDLSKEKQGRPGGKNGMAIPCTLVCDDIDVRKNFSCRKDAVLWLLEEKHITSSWCMSYIIKRLKSADGYCGWKIE